MPNSSRELTVRAPAKLNLCLEVLGRRADGYHELATVFQAVDLHDVLTFRPSPDLVLDVVGEAPAGDYNLVMLAARALAKRAPGVGAHIRLTKRIPSGAGLGGGSSDAAATISALNRLWNLDLSESEAAAVGRALGADVPFFLLGGAALGTGRGEMLTPIQNPSRSWFVVALPDLRLEAKTAQVFRTLQPEEYTDGARASRLAQTLGSGRAPSRDELFNGLTSAAYRAFDGLDAYVQALASGTRPGWTLSGAGPSVFLLAASQRDAYDVARTLERLPGRRYVVHSVGPEADRRAEPHGS